VKRNKLTKKKKELLRQFVEFKCEECHRHEFDIGELEAHRIKQGGEYSLRNIKMVCNYNGKIDGKISCHKMFNAAQRIAQGTQSR
jgi:hypothetical protein